jgi:hypothetical protein
MVVELLERRDASQAILATEERFPVMWQAVIVVLCHAGMGFEEANEKPC